ncbi:D-aminoacyl-tRNA deacylase [soil metagenome]
MRVLIQRVSDASVRVDGVTIASIGPGLLLLAGVTHDDDQSTASRMASRIANLRVLDDENGVMNRSMLNCLETNAASAEIMVVSQFTLYADCRKGRRPSYTQAACPELAESLVGALCSDLRASGIPVQQGQFGAEMVVSLTNQGPVTIWLDSDDLFHT